jgi:peptide/nickel transport system permease protein
MSRVRYFVKRTLLTVVLLWFVLTFLFALFRSMPGSMLDMLSASGASPETLEHLREAWGLDEPLHVQYVSYVTSVATGDLGQSIQYRQPVWSLVRMRLFNTFILVAPAITLAYILGTLYGLLAGIKRGSRFERYSPIPIIFAGSVPAFVTSIFLIVIFAGWFDLFPSGGLMSINLYNELQEIAWWRPYLSTNFAHHYVLPATAVVLRYLFLPSLMMRTSVVEVSDQPFAFYHRITGLPAAKRLKHIARHASLPVITMYPIGLARSLSGLVLIETVFNWPGVGAFLVDAVLVRDIPVMMFLFFMVAAFVIVGNYIVDVLYTLIDPRIDLN